MFFIKVFVILYTKLLKPGDVSYIICKKRKKGFFKKTRSLGPVKKKKGIVKKRVDAFLFCKEKRQHGYPIEVVYASESLCKDQFMLGRRKQKGGRIP
jgi:hypothetical protein